MNSKLYRYSVRLGPGGIHCSCCHDGSLMSAKRAARRGARRMGRIECAVGLAEYLGEAYELLAELRADEAMIAELEGVSDNYGDFDEDWWDRTQALSASLSQDADLYLCCDDFDDPSWYDGTYDP